MKPKILLVLALVFVLPFGLLAEGQAEGGGLVERAVQAGVQAGLAAAEQAAPAVGGYNFQKSEFPGRNGMVACTSPLAAMMGVRILAEGGNAFDAAVVTAAMLTVELPEMCGIGGHGIATIYDAKAGKVRCLDFGGQLPAAFSIDQWGDPPVKPEFTVLPTILPGTLKGWATLLEEYGTISLAKALEPAIFYAENGVAAKPDLINFMNFFDEELFALHPELAKYMMPQGRFPKPGEVLKRPELADTYRLIARRGPDVFYKGELGDKIIAFLNENGSRFTKREFAEYKPRWREVISSTYRGRYEVFVPKAQVASPVILTLLNMWENFDLSSLGHYTPDYLHIMLESAKTAFADRRTYYGDPAFTRIPYDTLVSKEYGRQLAERIDMNRASAGLEPGDVSKLGGGHTTHLVVVDRWGNIVSLTQTLGFLWGSWHVVPGTGITLNNEGMYFDLEPPNGPNYPMANKLSQHDMSPTIIFKDGKPFMTLGTPGGEAITQIIPQVISNVIDFGMPVQKAVDAPRVGHIEGLWVQFEGLSQETERDLRRRGHDLDGWSIRGYINCIMIDHETGTLWGGADYDGMAIGY